MCMLFLQELSRELAAEKRRAAHTSRKLEQSNITCTELRESLALAQDTVSEVWGALLYLSTMHRPPWLGLAPSASKQAAQALLLCCWIHLPRH